MLNWRKSSDGRSTEKGEEVTSRKKILNTTISAVVKEIDQGTKKPLLPLLGAPGMGVAVEGGSMDGGGDEDRKKEEKRGTFKRLDKSRLVKGDGSKSEKTNKERKMDIDGEV